MLLLKREINNISSQLHDCLVLSGGPEARPQFNGLDSLFKKWERSDRIEGASD